MSSRPTASAAREAVGTAAVSAQPLPRYGVPLLGELPLDLRIREQADAGSPTVVGDPESAAARAYMSVARKAAAQLAAAAVHGAGVFPKISVEDNE